jgi:hypothetical protein
MTTPSLGRSLLLSLITCITAPGAVAEAIYSWETVYDPYFDETQGICPWEIWVDDSLPGGADSPSRRTTEWELVVVREIFGR